jgi:hypothetical protein
MSKLLFVDVGTHKGQEYRAIFQTSRWSYFKRFLNQRFMASRRKEEPLSISGFNRLLSNSSYLRSHRKDIHYVMVEPNSKLFCLPIYQCADLALCVALSKNAKSTSLARLYFANGDNTGEGSSLFETKPNVSTKDYSAVLNLDPTSFATMLKDYFENEYGSDYQVVLRINNEGAEVAVIESFYQVFSGRLIGILGSLADVQKVHGEKALTELYTYMKQNNVEFVPLFSAFSSWPKAINFLCEKCKD